MRDSLIYHSYISNISLSPAGTAVSSMSVLRDKIQNLMDDCLHEFHTVQLTNQSCIFRCKQCPKGVQILNERTFGHDYSLEEEHHYNQYHLNLTNVMRALDTADHECLHSDYRFEFDGTSFKFTCQIPDCETRVTVSEEDEELMNSDEEQEENNEGYQEATNSGSEDENMSNDSEDEDEDEDQNMNSEDSDDDEVQEESNEASNQEVGSNDSEDEDEDQK